MGPDAANSTAGIMLSGGLDSSILAAHLAQEGWRVQPFYVQSQLAWQAAELKAVKKPATKDREGINPFTKEKTIFKGKPASKKIRATALKALKDLIQ